MTLFWPSRTVTDRSRDSLHRVTRRAAITGAAIATVAIGRSVAATPKYDLKLGCIYAADSIQGRTTQKFADLVTEKTKGMMKLTVFPNAQLGDEQQMLQSVLSPVAKDPVTLSITILTTLEPAVGVTSLPFLFRDAAQVEAFATGPAFLAQRDLLLRRKGLRMLAAWDYPPVNIYTTKPVRTLSDMKGLKIRVPPAKQYVQLFQAFGANPTPVPYSEQYVALQTGVVNGTMGTDDNVLTSKFTEVIKYAIELRYQIMFGNPVVSERFYKTLSPGLQQALNEAAAEAGAYNRDLIASAQPGWQTALQKAGVEVIHVSDLDAWKAAVVPVVDAFEKAYGSDIVQLIKNA